MPAGLGAEPRPDRGRDHRACRSSAHAHVGETLRGALHRHPAGPDRCGACDRAHLPEDARSIVLLPQAIRQIAPNFVNTAVEIVKASSLLSAIGVGELLLTTQEIIGRTFMTMEFYALAGALYLVVNLTIGAGGWWLERRFRAAVGATHGRRSSPSAGLTKSFGAEHDPARRRPRGLPGRRRVDHRRERLGQDDASPLHRPARGVRGRRDPPRRRAARLPAGAGRPTVPPARARSSPGSARGSAWCSRATTSSRI